MGHNPSTGEKDELEIPPATTSEQKKKIIEDTHSEKELENETSETTQTTEQNKVKEDEKEEIPRPISIQDEDILCTLKFVLNGHSHNIKSVVCIPPPNENICVTCSDDTNIIIWDFGENPRMLKKLTDSNSAVTQIILWDSTSILSCSMGSYIHHYSILPPYTLIRKFRISIIGSIYKLLKLSNDTFLSVSSNAYASVSIHKFPGMNVIRSYRVTKLDWTSVPKISEFHENCIYLNTNRKLKDRSIEQEYYNPIFLMNYVVPPMNVKKYNFKNSNKVSGYITFINHRKQEILVVNTANCEMWVFNASVESTEFEVLRKFLVSKWIYGIKCFQGRFILTGDGIGKVAIYDSQNDFARVLEKEVFDEGICLDLDIVKSSDFGKRLLFVVVGTEFCVKLFEVELKVTKIEFLDLEERTRYVNNILSKEMDKEFVLRIDCGNHLSIENVFRSILL